MEKTKKLAVGILAHVDAGKTTLAEGILYKTGQIRKAGRVDHKDAFLDTEELEKARGITIFSKQAVLKLNETEVTLLDTPGHVDFSAEMERTLQVMDYAVLLISGADGVQGHVETLWRLLARYEIPVFLFINKMDQPGTDAEKLLEELQSRLSEHCLNFSQDLQNAELLEELAMCDEDVLEQYLETGSVEEDQICMMIAERKVFPCCFGSALKMEGVTEFLKILDRFTKTPEYGGDFGGDDLRRNGTEQHLLRSGHRQRNRGGKTGAGAGADVPHRASAGLRCPSDAWKTAPVRRRNPGAPHCLE